MAQQTEYDLPHSVADEVPGRDRTGCTEAQAVFGCDRTHGGRVIVAAYIGRRIGQPAEKIEGLSLCIGAQARADRLFHAQYVLQFRVRRVRASM